MYRVRTLVTFAAGLLWLTAAAAAEPPPIDPRGVSGSLVIVGGGSLPDEIRQTFLKLAGGEQARLVIVPTAGTEADDPATHPRIAAAWERFSPAAVTVLHTRDREQADDAEFSAPLKEATGVWFSGGLQSRIAAAYLGTRVETELQEVLSRGGVIGGTSAGAAIQSRTMISGGNPVPNIRTGFDLLPGAIVDQHFLARNRQPRLDAAVREHPHLFGVGIDESTALIVQGRRLQVIGESTVTIVFAESPQRPATAAMLQPGETADLVAFQRTARARASGAVPTRTPGSPLVESGAVVLIGGGGVPKEVVERMLELAGGPDVPIVVLPTAVPDAQARQAGVPDFFKRAGCTDVTVLPQTSRDEVESSEFLEALGRAKLVWFGGGRQWRFVDAYAGTKAETALHDVLRRGGVIAGSSAGATIQGDYLCRGNPLGNLDIICEGYERGFAFLPGVAIDQHFAERKRFDDMAGLVRTFPQFLGIGLDESTALIVRQQTGEVLGAGQVHFYDRRQTLDDRTGSDSTENEAISPVSLSSGGRYDLVTGAVQNESNGNLP